MEEEVHPHLLGEVDGRVRVGFVQTAKERDVEATQTGLSVLNLWGRRVSQHHFTRRLRQTDEPRAAAESGLQRGQTSRRASAVPGRPAG